MAGSGRLAEQARKAWDWMERDIPPATAPFADPRSDEAWWWLGVPLFVAAAAPAIYAIDRDFYNAAINQEGWGLLELSHVVIPLAAFVLAIALLRDPLVWRSWLLRVWIGLAALGSFYIAGEEASWGQHLIGWETPAGWQAINDQNETNLHNVSSWLDQKPRLLLQIGILVGGIALPLAMPYLERLRRSNVALIVPPAALMPTAMLVVVYHIVDDLRPSMKEAPWMVTRPAEVQETFLVLFVLFYLIVFRRRMAQLRPAGLSRAAPDGVRT